VSVAAWAIDNGHLTTPNDVLSFFEKPWHYPEYHTEWKAEHESVGTD
jgi:hypothetical protein